MKFWVDENFNGAMLRGLQTQLSNIEIVRVQDTSLKGIDDVTLLAEAAAAGVILITHDMRTLINFAFDRVKAGLIMPGVIEVKQTMPVSIAVQDLVLMIGAGFPDDFENQVRYIPIH